MTNEEKAKDLAKLEGSANNPVVSSLIEKKTLEMAKWKEQQIINWLKNKAANYVVCEEAEFSHYATKSMIEDLKKAMKEE